MKTVILISFFIAGSLSIFSQQISTKILTDAEIKEVFLTRHTPQEALAIHNQIKNKTYNIILEYRGKPIFMDALAKNGGLFISFGRQTRFCFKETEIEEKDREILYAQADLKLKYDLHNPDFLCSTAFQIFKKNDKGEMELVHLLPGILVTKIVELTATSSGITPIEKTDLSPPLPASPVEVQIIEPVAPVDIAPSMPASPQWPIK